MQTSLKGNSMEGNSHPEIGDLRRIRSLSQFSDEQLSILAAKLPLRRTAKNECLIELGCSESFSLYLISGALIATTHDGNQTRFASSSEGEMFPIAQLRPSMYRVVAGEPSQYIRIYADQLTEFAQNLEGKKSGLDVVEMDVIEIEQSDEENALTIQLFQDLISGNLALPSLPNVAQRIQQAFADDAVNAESICTIIQSDPAITAKLIMISNSALYRGQAQIESLQQAVVRLGLETTRKQVMTYAVKELFQSKTPDVKVQMQKLWKHSQHVACLCRLMANHLTGFDLEQAQLAGLIHDLGEVAILQYAQQNENLIGNPELLMQAVRKLRPQITGMLLNQWNFGPEFVTVGEECEDWFRNPADEADLCDLVLIAQYHAMIGSSETTSLPPVPTLPAFAKLGMGDLDIKQIMAFLSRSRAEIQAIEAHLGAI
ncbi:MAG: HDOD domain-containing protein [Gammaproteobacteria bacterium]|nr:HDOD domain-containing protein [Gammaproteobacteria bacterium]